MVNLGYGVDVSVGNARFNRIKVRKQNIVNAVHGKTNPIKKVANIAACDVAGALAGLHENVYYYAQALFADDRRAANKCWILLADLAAKQWPEISPSQSNVLALLSIEGKIWRTPCGHCGGNKFIVAMNGKKTDCKRCHGTASSDNSDVRSARMLGVSESIWRLAWRKRVTELQSMLDQYESIALAHITRQFPAN